MADNAQSVESEGCKLGNSHQDNSSKKLTAKLEQLKRMKKTVVGRSEARDANLKRFSGE